MQRSMLRTLVLSLGVAIGSSASAQAATHFSFFYSPSGNISCEVDSGRADVADRAFCQTVAPARTVTMTRNGRFRVCTGGNCLGDPPENTPTLAYGRSVTVGTFRCSSRASGITCTSSGHGFVISRAGVRAVA